MADSKSFKVLSAKFETSHQKLSMQNTSSGSGIGRIYASSGTFCVSRNLAAALGGFLGDCGENTAAGPPG
jgi:hypothetical protein